MVLVHHVAEGSHALFAPGAYPARLVLVGVSSVDLFFVISGFIMLHTTWTQLGREGAVRNCRELVKDTLLGVLRSQGVPRPRRDDPPLDATEVTSE